MGESRQEQVIHGLAKIGMALRSQAWRQGEKTDLTPTQAEILAILNSRPIGMRLSEVATALAVSAPTASDAVATLVGKRLMRKTRSSNDGRALVLRLTQAGRRKAEQASHWPDFLLNAVDELNPAEQAVFHRALIKMIRTLQRRGDIPVARMCVTCRYFKPYAHPDANAPHHCGYVDASFGEAQLRIDCADHQPADSVLAADHWRAFTASVTDLPGE